MGSVFLAVLVKSLKADVLVIAADPNHLEAKYRLASVLEEIGQRSEAYELVMEGKYSSMRSRDAP